MSAKRKLDHSDAQAAPEEVRETAKTERNSATTVGKADLESDTQPAPSPARVLQEQLHESISSEKQRAPAMDIGRVLAASSGITAIMGVFFFSGLW
ncbi:hypothetical protein WNY37_08395 [Henriciella sp. AS95]|uniref:hypothetical protein n=1 Tax=Henriciella sp. AS95 TaxID=3135782 RepID=UPI00316F89F7